MEPLNHKTTIPKQITLNCTQTKKFHFQEINKIIHFPPQQNHTKYRNYNIQVKTTKTINQPTPPTSLGDFLDTPEIENNYPHTVGYFKESTVQDGSFKPEYLELRKICTVEDFWMFLNAQNI